MERIVKFESALRTLLDKPSSPFVHKDIIHLFKRTDAPIEKFAYLISSKNRSDLLLDLLQINPSVVRYVIQLVSSHIIDFPIEHLCAIWKLFFTIPLTVEIKFSEGFKNLFEEGIRTVNKKRQTIIFLVLSHNCLELENKKEFFVLLKIVKYFIYKFNVAPTHTTTFLYLLQNILEISFKSENLLNELNQENCLLFLRRLINVLSKDIEKEGSELQVQTIKCLNALSAFETFSKSEIKEILNIIEPYLYKKITRNEAQIVKKTYKCLEEEGDLLHKEKGDLSNFYESLPKESIEQVLKNANIYQTNQWLKRKPFTNETLSKTAKINKNEELHLIIEQCLANIEENNFVEHEFYEKNKKEEKEEKNFETEEDKEIKIEQDISELIDLAYSYKFFE